MPRIYEEETLLTIYSYDNDYIYVGSREKLVKQGTSIPANSTIIQPPSLSEGEIAVFNEEEESWIVITDIRDREVWNTLDKTKIKARGAKVLNENETLIEPNTSEDIWNGSQWITPDSAKEKILIEALQIHVNRQAKSEGFYSILDAVSYAEEPTEPTRQAKGQALRAWRSQCFISLDNALQQNPLPNIQQFISSLPDYP